MVGPPFMHALTSSSVRSLSICCKHGLAAGITARVDHAAPARMRAVAVQVGPAGGADLGGLAALVTAMMEVPWNRGHGPPPDHGLPTEVWGCEVWSCVLWVSRRRMWVRTVAVQGLVLWRVYGNAQIVMQGRGQAGRQLTRCWHLCPIHGNGHCRVSEPSAWLSLGGLLVAAHMAAVR